MKFIETGLKGCFVVEPNVIEDSRGYFFESYHQQKFRDAIGYELNFVQDNQSKSGFGVVRGLHIQRGKFAQAKFVSVLSGKILDVALDARKDSITYGQYFKIELSAENRKQLFIPHGFLHGFSVLSEEAEVFYKCSNFYDRDSEDGVHPFDQDLKIDWQIPPDKIMLSEKDKNAQTFSEFNPF
jgi:dTDP-4-dehydrorhamnose 3,5-epimerase